MKRIQTPITTQKTLIQIKSKQVELIAVAN
jgi:hypothetical protein